MTNSLSWDFPFWPEDFDNSFGITEADYEHWVHIEDVRWKELRERAADAANAKFRELCEKYGKRVWKCAGMGHYDKWIEDRSELDEPASHSAILIAEKQYD